MSSIERLHAWLILRHGGRNRLLARQLEGVASEKAPPIHHSLGSKPSILSVLTTVDANDARIYKFWLLTVGGLCCFTAWLALFAYSAGAVPGGTGLFPAAFKDDSGTADPSGQSEAVRRLLFCVDVWFALGLMAAVDATAIVLNFKRSLIHQFHYFVSLRMMSLAFFISAACVLLTQSEYVEALGVRLPRVINVGICGLLYAASIVITAKLHKLLPIRGIANSRGSLQEYSERMCEFDLPWKRAMLYAALNGAVGFVLTTLVPPKWSMLNPVVHITWEVTMLGFMATKQTPRYIWFATPVVQAATCTDWGLRQVVAAPALVMPPWAFLAVMLAGRLLLDLHLRTLLRGRADLQWARREVLVSTHTLLLACSGLLLLEYCGMPVVTFLKLGAVLMFHTLGVLVFLLPASYAIVFDKIKVIRP